MKSSSYSEKSCDENNNTNRCPVKIAFLALWIEGFDVVLESKCVIGLNVSSMSSKDVVVVSGLSGLFMNSLLLLLYLLLDTNTTTIV